MRNPYRGDDTPKVEVQTEITLLDDYALAVIALAAIKRLIAESLCFCAKRRALPQANHNTSDFSRLSYNDTELARYCKIIVCFI